MSLIDLIRSYRGIWQRIAQHVDIIGWYWVRSNIKRRQIYQVLKRRYVAYLDDGTKTVDNLLSKDIFDYPKPITLIHKMLHLATEIDSESIILDFFSGSASTAHAVMQLNAEDEAMGQARCAGANHQARPVQTGYRL